MKKKYHLLNKNMKQHKWFQKLLSRMAYLLKYRDAQGRNNDDRLIMITWDHLKAVNAYNLFLQDHAIVPMLSHPCFITYGFLCSIFLFLMPYFLTVYNCICFGWQDFGWLYHVTSFKVKHRDDVFPLLPFETTVIK